MNNSETLSRRNFIGSTALAGAAASFPYVARGDALESDTIRVAAIGLAVEDWCSYSNSRCSQRFGETKRYSL